MAISKLIIPPKPADSNTQDATSGAQRYAQLFVDTMGDKQRDRFKAMLGTGAIIGQSISQSYNIPHEEFIAEVQKII